MRKAAWAVSGGLILALTVPAAASAAVRLAVPTFKTNTATDTSLTITLAPEPGAEFRYILTDLSGKLVPTAHGPNDSKTEPGDGTAPGRQFEIAGLKAGTTYRLEFAAIASGKLSSAWTPWMTRTTKGTASKPVSVAPSATTGLLGYNADPANWTSWSASQVQAYFASMPKNGVTRIWALPNTSHETSIAQLESFVNTAKQYNQTVQVTLGDADGNTGQYGNDDDTQDGGSASWYTSGWSGSWKTWASGIVAALGSTVRYELPNEIFNEYGLLPGSSNGSAQITDAQAQAYIAGSVSVIKAAGGSYVIAGFADTDDVGGTAGLEAILKGTGITEVQFHAYTSQELSGDLTEVRTAASALGIHWGCGELSSSAGIGEANTYLADGASSVEFWDYEATSQSWDTYQILPGSALQKAVSSD